MISFTHHQTGETVAKELARSPEDLVECLEEILMYFDSDPDLIIDVHNNAVNMQACKKLRKLGTILSNMQGD